MTTRRAITILCLCLVAASGATAAKRADWPREVRSGDATIVLYQPQFDSLEGELPHQFGILPDLLPAPGSSVSASVARYSDPTKHQQDVSPGKLKTIRVSVNGSHGMPLESSPMRIRSDDLVMHSLSTGGQSMAAQNTNEECEDFLIDSAMANLALVSFLY